MKKYIFIYAVFIQFITFGQKVKETYVKITYKKILENPNIKNFDATLYIKGDKSLFTWKSSRGNKEKLQDGTTMYYSNTKVKDFDFMLNLLTKNIFYTRLFVNNKECLIKEKNIKPKWVLINEYKDINKFKCQKAETIINGVKHYVWFTNQIPIPFGPNKFYFGLNGLVLEGHDENNIMSFFVKEIIINDKSIIDEVNMSFNSLNANFNKTITVKEYDKIVDNYTLELEKRINSRRKKGFPIIHFKKDCDDCSKNNEKRKSN